MSRMWTTLAGLALMGSIGGAQESPARGKKPKEISAAGWFNSSGASLEKLKGKVVVVEFWATWCPPCRKAIPHMIELRKKLDASQVEIIGLTDEPKEKVEGFVKEMGMNYTVGYGSTSGADYGVNGIPHAFIVGPDGLIQWDGHPMDEAFATTVTKLAATAKPLATAEPKKSLGEALSAALKAGGTPEGFQAVYKRADAAKKTNRELRISGLDYELKTEKVDSKKGRLEEKQLADLLKAIVDTEFATKENKSSAKAAVTILVSLGQEGREIGLDPVKGFGPFAKIEGAFADLTARLLK